MSAIRVASGNRYLLSLASGADDGGREPAAARDAVSALQLRRKGPLDMTTQPDRGTRRIKAAIIGFGLDGQDSLNRLTTGDNCVLLGGSAEAHAEMLETMLRLEDELERIGQPLGEISPIDLAEIAWRIDSPELHRIALQMHDGLLRQGRTFHESTAEELSELSA